MATRHARSQVAHKIQPVKMRKGKTATTIISCSCAERCQHQNVYAVDDENTIYRSKDSVTFTANKELTNLNVKHLLSTEMGVVAITQENKVLLFDKSSDDNIRHLYALTDTLKEKAENTEDNTTLVDLALTRFAAAAVFSNGEVIVIVNLAKTGTYAHNHFGILNDDAMVKKIVLSEYKTKSSQGKKASKVKLQSDFSNYFMVISYDKECELSIMSLNQERLSRVKADVNVTNIYTQAGEITLEGENGEIYTVKTQEDFQTLKLYGGSLETELVYKNSGTKKVESSSNSRVELSENNKLKVRLFTRVPLRHSKAKSYYHSGWLELGSFPLPHNIKKIEVKESPKYRARVNILMDNGEILVIRCLW